MSPAERERLRELRERAATGDEEAATMVALLTDPDTPDNDPRDAIKARAAAAYALPEIDLEQQRANIAADTAAGTALGLDEYEKKDEWHGRGLLGTPFAGLMNMRKSMDDKKEGRINTEVLGLRRAREAKRLAAEGLANRQGNIAANSSIETVNNREAGQDFTVDRYGVGRVDDATDRDEQRAYTAKLLQEERDYKDRVRGETPQEKPSSTQTTIYNDSMDALDVIGDMDRRRANLSDSDKALYGDAMRDIGTSAAPALLKGVVGEAAYGGSPDVQKLRAQERKAMAAFRLLISGKQVTGPEFIREADWSPTAAGLTAEERERRWDIMNDETANTVARHEGTFSNYIEKPYEARAQDSRIESIQSEIDRVNAQIDAVNRSRQ